MAAAAVQQSAVPTIRRSRPAIKAIDEYGYKKFGRRLVDGLVLRVVVQRGFTVQGLPFEENDPTGFETRMAHFADELEKNGSEVTNITIHTRPGRVPWAEFDVTLPEFHLPIPIGQFTTIN